ncbi:hypothetical protein ACFYT3_00165 [Nocardia amikacinitolerans]|uniref:hypothetical protein n=1 Tax=Nocardia amikacinitolerans TaxID=756689 RepID=UPI0036B9E09F
MYLPLPFPACPSCALSWATCAHRNCGGEIEVEPMTRSVRCQACRGAWNIMASVFYCSCGHSFSASEVAEAIDGLMDTCRRLLTFIDDTSRSDAQFRARTDSSLRRFISEVFYALGDAAGFAIGKLLGRFL